jgi:phytoene dehydrogenase-like protein
MLREAAYRSGHHISNCGSVGWVGGRVRTDEVEGFLLDRGFQVLLTADPEARKVLDYSRLDLKSFSPGALSWFAGRMNPIVDRWRMPSMWREALRSEFGRLGDKLRMARLRSRLKHTSIAEIFKRPERSTKDALKSEGISQEIIHRFFRPFLGGILLDGELKTTSRMFQFVFKMLSEQCPRAGHGSDSGADWGEIQGGFDALELAS